MRLLLDTHAFLRNITADPRRPANFLAAIREPANEVPIDEGAMTHLAGLPRLHRDPFDRLLIAQALQHGLTIATVDADIAAYSVPRLLMA